MRYLRIVLLVLSGGFLLPDYSSGQSIDEGWVSHTPFRSIQAISTSDDHIWAATDGGVFSYSITSGEISTYTTTQGLSGIDAQSIASAEDGSEIWVGYGSGVLDLITPATGNVETFFDISRAQQFSSKGIGRLEIKGDSLFAATDFGLVIFDTIKREVRDSYIRFGDFDAGIAVNDFLFLKNEAGEEKLYVATADGLAFAPAIASNLKEPGVWSSEPGVALAEPLRLKANGSELLIGTTIDLYARQETSEWLPFGITERGVTDFIIDDQILFPNQTPYYLVVERFAIVAYFLDGSPPRALFAKDDSEVNIISYQNPNSLVQDSSSRLWLGDLQEGLARIGTISGNTASLDHTIIPDGPFNALFTDMQFDENGVLWASGASRVPGNGFHSFGDGTWSSFTLRNIPELVNRAAYDHINIDEEGRVWAGSAGFGLAIRNTDGTIEIFDESNSTLQIAPGTTNYVRVRGMATERGVGTWLLNRFSTRPINLRASDGSWNALPALNQGGVNSGIDYDDIFVDSFGQKWIKPLNSDGIIIWGTGSTPLDSSDDQVAYHRQLGSGGSGLPNRRVTAWAEDLNGRIWVGTERGIAFYFNAGNVLAQANNESQIIWPINEAGDAYLLRDVFVNDLAVDPANQLWIASGDGAWLIDDTASKVLMHITSENSPLLSDNILSVAVDKKTGDVFFATDVGVQSWRGNAVEPQTKSGDLSVYPNPIRLSDESDESYVVVEGLVGESTIRIVTIDGAAVRSIDSRGGRAIWNLKDEFGNFVPSGIYLVVSTGSDGEGVSVGKVAVLN